MSQGQITHFDISTPSLLPRDVLLLNFHLQVGMLTSKCPRTESKPTSIVYGKQAEKTKDRQWETSSRTSRGFYARTCKSGRKAE